MLVLSRKPGEVIRIGDDVKITVVRIGPNTVRIGVEAPRDMNIARAELCPLRQLEPATSLDQSAAGTRSFTVEIDPMACSYLGLEFVEGPEA